jgi:aminoglycoside/choline kinase family phosphotransferase
MSEVDRATQRLTWVRKQLGHDQVTLARASEDASFRSYWRATTSEQTLILMDAPPAHEDCRPFIDITKRLRSVAVNAPRIHAQDLQLGFLLLDDFGEALFSQVLNSDSVNALYQDALLALGRMQTIKTDGLPHYNAQLLSTEMALFTDWLMDRHLGMPRGSEFEQQWQQLQRVLIENALEQPQVFVHRDYHCRNLMQCPNDNPGVLDYQDAVLGPITYDLVSLLRDCYISWPLDAVHDWAERYRLNAVENGLTDAGPETWQRWFDLMGLQRHLKASGIFCRLCHRDGKSGFLEAIPRTLGYAHHVAEKYPELNGFEVLIEDALSRFGAARS